MGRNYIGRYQHLTEYVQQIEPRHLQINHGPTELNILATARPVATKLLDVSLTDIFAICSPEESVT